MVCLCMLLSLHLTHKRLKLPSDQKDLLHFRHILLVDLLRFGINSGLRMAVSLRKLPELFSD